MFTVAIIGRPNAGKSTLFNRLTGKRNALVADVPGLTRDWREGNGRIGPMQFRLLDTAGMEEAEKNSLPARMTEHSLQATEQAQVVLFLLDGRAGLTATDRHFANLLRKTGKPVVVVVNKAENMQAAADALAEAHDLGFGVPVPVSAEHGEGMDLLYEALAPFAPEDEEAEEKARGERPLNLAIIGRPNAGKSTLINQLIGEERQLVGPEAGITRDSIAIPFTYEGRAITLVDTAGLRRRARIDNALEKISASDAIRAIKFAEVVVVLMDATLAFEKQDLQLAELAAREGRAVLLGVNKWDLVAVKDREAYLEAARERVEKSLPQLRDIPIVPLSAMKESGLKALMQGVFKVEKWWNTRLSTGQLNRWLEEALARHAPPLIKGRRLKIRYMTQVSARPPSFALFANLSPIPDHYERYLVNGLREHFNLPGVPIRFAVRKGKNPYEEKDA